MNNIKNGCLSGGKCKKKKVITSSHDIMKEQFTSGHDDHSVLLLMIM